MKTLEALGLNMLFVVGGDGTHSAANAIYATARERGMKISVVGIPKTIDNDISLIDRSFGFETSIEEAQRAIISAKVEAKASINGVGIVRLMGRHSGAITLMASLASNDVDIALIPEIPFNEKAFLEHLDSVLERQGHAVVVAAEGMAEVVLKELQEQHSAQELAKGGATQSISGDIGVYLKSSINEFLKQRNKEHRLVNIDPTYMIRSIPANAGDKVYCTVLSQQAVHGAMSGFTGFSAGMVSTNYVYIPITDIIQAGPRKVDPQGQMWYRLVTSTQQPAQFVASPPQDPGQPLTEAVEDKREEKESDAREEKESDATSEATTVV
uniref:Phosphofructokinase domain-containing protein n=1 Tax=Lotharella oceanica TaxID=641309 RepID=A0A7S2TVM4_9EUKA